MNSLSSDREETLDQLALLNLQEFFTSLGIGDFKRAKQVLTRILQPVSRWFAELLLEFDQEVEQFGLPVAAQHA
ncbi:MAG TPA: hypothetical protein VHO48_00925, partial [Anaerolineaceae bacterium]|nr:hypothetical protein [Anaerolineaceae bacterium]